MRTRGWKCPTSSAVMISMRPNPNALYESASPLELSEAVPAVRDGDAADLPEPGRLSGLHFELG